jgi:hypothetical protein
VPAREGTGTRSARSDAETVDACRVEDFPHGGGTDLVAESDKFSMHAALSPGGISMARHGQGADAGGDGRAACPPGRGGPLSADELTVPAQDRRRGDQESAAATSGEQSGEYGDHGAVAPVEPRSWCASLQDGQLMAQNEDLDLLGGVGASV